LESWLKNCQIELFKFYSVKDLYLNDDFMDAIKR
ncbi:excisionase, partial [Salmonella enterica]|nr:excisionase [Salmonella enterica]